MYPNIIEVPSSLFHVSSHDESHKKFKFLSNRNASLADEIFSSSIDPTLKRSKKIKSESLFRNLVPLQCNSMITVRGFNLYLNRRLISICIGTHFHLNQILKICSLSAKNGELPALISKSLSTAKNLQHLNQIHSLIVISGLAQSAFFSGKLISSYAKFKYPSFSRLVFRRISEKKNVFLWNSIIRALTQNGFFAEALNFYFEMQSFGLVPDNFTFPSVLSACASLSYFQMGRQIHAHLLELGFGSDLYIGNALVNMYATLGSCSAAHRVFDKMPQRDIVSWNTLISGYSGNQQWEKALEVFHELKVEGLVPDSFTVVSVLPACGSLLAIEGLVVHGFAHKTGIEKDKLVSNGLLAMYCKFNYLTDARKFFDKMPERDTISWNTMIGGYSQSGVFEEAIQLFQEMVIKFKPDLLTLTSILRACGHTGDLEQGRSVHNYMINNGYECDTTASNILITMYANCRELQSSQEVFDRMGERDLVSWNSLINGYVQNGCCHKGVEIFRIMKKMGVQPDSVTIVTLLSTCSLLVDIREGQDLHSNIIKMGLNSDLLVSNAIIDMYTKCGSMEDGLRHFEKMKTKDLISWNTIIVGCFHNGNCSLGFKMLIQMRGEGVIPDMATMLGILPACSFLSSKRYGKEIHGCILKYELESYLPIRNALIEMYSKCGSLENSNRVFEHTKEKDVVTWTVLIFAYGMHGCGKKALEAFTRMNESGIKPDGISFIAIIYACSHSGLVEEGLASFDQMQKTYKITPKIEHYACVVDLLSRSGQLEEAEKFIHAMPLQPDTSIWGSLLSACRITGETQIAERVSRQILELDSDNAGYYVLISNLYASRGKWDKVGKIRKNMKARQLKKDPGFSWIEIGSRVHLFGTGERLGEQSQEVYLLLEELAGLMAKEGYVADKNFVLHDVEEDDKIDMLCGHSERLAIAFGLLNTQPGTPLQIMKNLRVCGDCHTVTKFIAKIMQRELIVRDANRFHRFKDGACSCEDYW